MKTFFKLAPLALAFFVSSTFAAEFIGWTLPAAIEPLPAFAGFVMSLVVLIAFKDYSRPGVAAAPLKRGTSASPWRHYARTADHALAA